MEIKNSYACKATDNPPQRQNFQGYVPTLDLEPRQHKHIPYPKEVEDQDAKIFPRKRIIALVPRPDHEPKQLLRSRVRLSPLITKPVQAGAARIMFCKETIQRSCSYVFYYKRYVKRLEHGIQGLCDVRAGLQQKVDTAISQKMSISSEVESWIREVDTIEAATQRFVSEVNSRKHLYWPMARYSLSHKCVEKLQLLREREHEGNQFHDVADPAPPPRIGSTFVRILNPINSRPSKVTENLAIIGGWRR